MNIEIDEGAPYDNEQPEPAEQVEQEVVEVEEAAEAEEAIEVEQEEQTEVTPLTDAARKAINKKHFQYKEEERQKLALQKELDQLRSQMEQQPAQASKVPPVPDRYDYDTEAEYNQAVEERDSVLRKIAADESRQAQIEALQMEQQQQEAFKRAQQRQESERKLLEDAKQAGVTQEALNEAVYTISNYNLGETFASEMINAPNASQLIVNLANNPLELEKLSMMNDYQKGVYFATNILPKAQSIKPKVSKAPPPPKDIHGKGADPSMGKFKNITGATFE